MFGIDFLEVSGGVELDVRRQMLTAVDHEIRLCVPVSLSTIKISRIQRVLVIINSSELRPGMLYRYFEARRHRGKH